MGLALAWSTLLRFIRLDCYEKRLDEYRISRACADLVPFPLSRLRHQLKSSPQELNDRAAIYRGSHFDSFNPRLNSCESSPEQSAAFIISAPRTQGPESNRATMKLFHDRLAVISAPSLEHLYRCRRRRPGANGPIRLESNNHANCQSSLPTLSSMML